MKKFPTVFTSDTSLSEDVAKAVKSEKARKIGPRLYTTNMKDEPARIVRQNWWQILSLLVPGCVVSHRTALEGGISPTGRAYVTGAYRRTITLPGLEIIQQKGQGPVEGDLPMLEMHVSSQARAFLENLAATKTRKGETKTLSQEQLERKIADFLQANGEDGLNALRDRARVIAESLELADEFQRLDQLIGTLLGTRSADLSAPLAKAYARREPYDPLAIERIDFLRAALLAMGGQNRPKHAEAGTAFYNSGFYDAYFSNFIEGTRFEVEEAYEIVETGHIPVDRPEDGHDILGTYRVVGSLDEMTTVPVNFEDFLDRLARRHAIILKGRPDKRPGQFKELANFAGQTRFVAPDLVSGTLKLGYEMYRSLEHPFARALVMMFLIAEVHPFDDGNGRIARAMMNAELICGGQVRIFIPSVFRNEYISGLKRLSHHSQPEAFIKVMSYAQKFVSLIDFSDRKSANDILRSCNAFADPAENVKLRLPPE
ncbi:MAG: Fic family protein [Desulfuromonadales bacterium]|nr:Fic family protein [Desulfuromonadales bacterium]